jgi:hypothetical protein
MGQRCCQGHFSGALSINTPNVPWSHLVVSQLAELLRRSTREYYTQRTQDWVSPKLPCHIRYPRARCGSPSLCDVLRHVARSALSRANPDMVHETRYSSTRASIIRYHATVSKRTRMPHTRVPHSTSEISSWHCPVVSSCAAL